MPRNALEIGSQRRYRCPAHPGERYVSVTTALSRSNEWGLPAGYAAKQTAEWAWANVDDWLALPREDAIRAMKKAHMAKRDAAADAGTLVHAAAERIISGTDWREPTPATGYELPEALWPIAEAIESWWRSSGYRVEMVERTVYHHLIQVAGTLDALVTDGTESLILDWKTQAYRADEKWRLQLAAYADAEEWADEDDVLHPMPPVAGGLVFWIPRERPEEWQVIRLDVGMEARAAFRSVLHAWRFLGGESDAAEGVVVASGAAREEAA